MKQQKIQIRQADGTLKEYALVVLRVTGWDDQGRPSQAVIGYDDTTFDLRDPAVSREFVTAFIPAAACAPRTRNN